MIYCQSVLGLFVPVDTLGERNAASAKYIQSTANGQVNEAIGQCVYPLQIGHRTSATGIGNRNTARCAQQHNQIVIYSRLQALDICSVNQKFGTVR